MLPESIKDYNDEIGDDYDEHVEHGQYDGRKSHFQQLRQKQPWRFVLLNYGHGAHRNRKTDQSTGNGKALHSTLSSGSNVDDLVSPRSQQLMQKLYRGKQQKAADTNANADANDSSNDLNWITSNAEMNSANDYDAQYDDVNENRSSSSSLKFDRYRRNGPMAPAKQHLN